MQSWVRMPSRWLRQKEADLILPKMVWVGDGKAAQISALMIYIVMVHHARRLDQLDREDVINGDELPYQNGEVNLSYSDMQKITDLSRTMVSAGIKILVGYGLIQRLPESKGLGKKARYIVDDFDGAFGWAKLPMRKLYRSGVITAFGDFNLRKRTELDALKIYLIIVAFRDRNANETRISFDKISDYTGVTRNYIKAALSFLVVQNLIQVDKHLNEGSELMNHNVYRVRHIESTIHAGTSANSFDTKRPS